MADEFTTLLPAGYQLRPPQVDDLDGCLALLDRCANVKDGAGRTNRVDLLAEWGAPGVTRDDNFRVIMAPDGATVGYAEAWNQQTPPVHVYCWGRVDPAHHGRGLGRTLLAWSEAVARSSIDRCPPDARVTMRAGVDGGYPPTRRLFARWGMTMVRSFHHMEIRFDGAAPIAPPLPAGVQLVPYCHPDDLSAVIAADLDAFQDHWGFMERPLEEEVAMWQHFVASNPDFAPELWFVAKDGDEIAGICLCESKYAEDPSVAYVNSLAVRRPWRGHGLGTALLRHAFLACYRRGTAGVALGVDAENLSGATRLYENAGMQVLRTTDVYEQELRPGITLTNPG